MLRIALYAEVDPNLVEGPAIWLATVALMLSRGGCEVTVLLRTARRHDEVLAAIDGAERIAVVDPLALGAASAGRQLSARQAVRLLAELDRGARFDAILVRGRRTAREAAANPAFHGRLAFYLTDFPRLPPGIGWLRRADLARTLQCASLLLCQTPEIADRLERQFSLPQTAATALLPPVADERAFGLAPARAPPPEETLRLAYIGKFAPAWNTLEMTALPALLARHGCAAELHVAGNKFIARADPRFAPRMRTALGRPGVKWSGGLPRLDALRLAAGCHVGLSWRAPQLDDSLELSSKLIDYGAVGLPAVCNPTPMHRRLLGDDYPLFAATSAEVTAAILRAAAEPAVWGAARDALRSLAIRHRANTIGAELAAALAAAFGDGATGQTAPAAGTGCAA
jgi:hypothetical protein